MAGYGGSGDDFEPFDTPKTPNLVLREGVEGELSPDTEGNVAMQTDGVFRNFFDELYTRDRSLQDADPSIPNPLGTTTAPRYRYSSPEEQVGRQLAIIGDDVNERYSSVFGRMIRLLKLDADTAYDGFAAVARQLFIDGTINWGRIIILLCFGYRIVVTLMQRGIRAVFANFVGFVVNFVVSERIARWVADQGGWRAALRYIPESVSWTTIGVVCGMAAISVVVAIYLTRQH